MIELELIYKIKKIKTPLCLGCNQENENLSHFLLRCSFYDEIRQSHLPKYILQNPSVSEIINDERQIIQCILDPLADKLPETVTANWKSMTAIYEHSRRFCYNMHRKREKLYSEMDKTSWNKLGLSLLYILYLCELECYWSKDRFLTLLL